MTEDTLEAFGKRWNREAKSEIAFEPEAEELRPGVVETGITALDEILGGGIPRGRTSIVFGESAAGKTLLTQLVIAAAQRRGGRAVFVDAERTYDPTWMALTGVDTSPEKLLVIRPQSLEQTFDIVCDTLANLQPEVLVVDSIPALVPQAMLDAEMTKQDFRGVHARKMTEGVAKATSYNRTTALIFINQLRVEMGKTFGNPEKMPGGKALQFHSSLILRVRRGKWLTDVSDRRVGEEDFTSVGDKDARRIGFLLRLRTEKNKIHTPWLDCDLEFLFNGTVDGMGSLAHLAIQRGVIEQPTKGYFIVPGAEGKIHGFERVKETLRADDELRDRLIALIKETE